MTLDETIKFYEAVEAAEKVMGPLSREEKTVVLSNFGKDLTHEELNDILVHKRALIVKGKNG